MARRPPHTTGPAPGSDAVDRVQDATTRRYDRNAFVYDLYDWPMDVLGGVRRRRRRLLGQAQGRVLEVGIGTGRNLDLYPPDVELCGVDVSGAMLARARRRAQALHLDREVELELADVRRLPFDDDTFDTTTATCVFCSVADPVAGLTELARVTRPEGQVLLLEHVRPRTAALGRLFDALNPLVRRLMGPNINRRTEANVTAAGLHVVAVERGGVWREIQAHPPRTATDIVTDGAAASGTAGGADHQRDDEEVVT